MWVTLRTDSVWVLGRQVRHLPETGPHAPLTFLLGTLGSHSKGRQMSLSPAHASSHSPTASTLPSVPWGEGQEGVGMRE